uniref:UDP-glycosyltransferase n=1 Tax=Ginkgo biloba TaxID=3311 RepID=A0A2Z2PG29_GINBI|nr:UDP-glycosyltransferase [Ginkgo biloba]
MAPGIERNGFSKTSSSMKPHVMMVSSLGHGHLLPFMQLSKKLASRGFTISFVTTFHHMPFLQNKVNAAQEDGLDIRLLEVKVPQDHLTLGKVNSNSVQWHHLPPILAANDRLQPHFELFLDDFLQRTDDYNLTRPLCLIADFLLGWASAVATKFGIPRVNFECSGSFSESVHEIVWKILPRNLERTTSGRYLVPDIPREIRLKPSQMLPELPEATETNGTHLFWKCHRAGNKQSWRTITNTFYELEGEFVDFFEKVYGPVRTIGPLLPPEAFQDSRKIIPAAVEMGSNTDELRCLQWLDRQAPRSVIYVSFGSENSVSSAQVMELAMGLERSRQKFLWVLRRPTDAGEASGSALDYLPNGFCDRVKEKDEGLIVLGWAPQLSILAHPSTGGFLSHCGWNAVLETTVMGVPMIAWPLYAEQHFNAKFVVDLVKIAVEAPQRAEENWLVRSDDIERVVRLLLEEEKGKELKARVDELKKIARVAVSEGGSSSNNFDLFVREILALEEQ